MCPLEHFNYVMFLINIQKLKHSSVIKTIEINLNEFILNLSVQCSSVLPICTMHKKRSRHDKIVGTKQKKNQKIKKSNETLNLQSKLNNICWICPYRTARVSIYPWLTWFDGFPSLNIRFLNVFFQQVNKRLLQQ